MNNDTPQPHNAFNGNDQPGQSVPSLNQDRRAPQSIDSFRRPAPQPRPLHSTGVPRPRHNMEFSRRPADNQPMPQRSPENPGFTQQLNTSANDHAARSNQMQDFGQSTQPGLEQQPMPQHSQENIAAGSRRVSVNPQTPHPNHARDSIYPTATGGFAAAHHVAQGSNTKATAKTSGVKQETITTLVVVFGSFMVVMSALSIVTWLRVGLKGTSEVVGLLLSLGELILAIGILLKREIARFIYVIVGCILLIFSIFGTVNYISQQTSNSNANSPQMIGLQQAIQKYQNDNSISDAQRAKYIAVLQKSESVVQKQQSSAQNSGKVLVPLSNILIGYVIALTPIVFLTRPSVKKVFS